MRTPLIAFIVLGMLTTFLYSQSGSINNTLGTGGIFSIKDGSTTFLMINQSNGYLSLVKSISLPITTSSTVGVIFKDNNRFIHDYKASSADGYNVFVGMNAGNFTMSGNSAYASRNTGVGYSVLSSLTTGYENSAFGCGALYSNQSGINNSAFGNISLWSNSTGSYNSAFGQGALFGNTTGKCNSAFGKSSLSSNSSDSNSAFGYYSLSSNGVGGNNSAFGSRSLTSNGSGSYNSAFGCNSLAANSSGYSNSAFGHSSLTSTTTGQYTSAFGYNSLLSNTEGSHNSSFGAYSLNWSQTGGSNSAFGAYALYKTTGTNNTALGDSAGWNVTTGSNVTCIGYMAQASTGLANNEFTLGNSSVSTLRCNTGTISSLSDARDKKNIRDLPLGLEFLMNVKPRLFNWDRREWYDNGKSDGSKMRTTPTAGFIAQELDEAQTKARAEWLNLVLKSNPEKLEATSGNLLPIMVKAIQELKTENDALKSDMQQLRAAIAQMKAEVIQNNDGKSNVSMNETQK